MMSGSRYAALLASVSTLFLASLAAAQIAAPGGFAGKVHLTHQEALVIHHQGQQLLVLQARFEIEERTAPSSRVRGRPKVSPEGAAASAPPARMAWIIPLPPGATPVDPPAGALEELYDVTHPSPKIKYRLRTQRPSAFNRFGESLFTDKQTQRGEDTIAWEVMEGSAALEGLRGRLQSLGFEGLNREVAEDYAERGWTFALGRVESPGESGMLGPAAFSFPSENLVFPMRFQADAGEFDLSLYVLSDKVWDKRGLSAWRIQGVREWENLHREAWFQGYLSLANPPFPPSLKARLEETGSGAFPGLKLEEMKLFAWAAARLNGYGRTTAHQTRDFALSEKGASASSQRGARQAPGRVRRY